MDWYLEFSSKMNYYPIKLKVLNLDFFIYVCQVEPGDGVDGSDLYLPEKWKTGNRLDWAAEDRRKKLFVGVEVNELF